MNDGGVFDFDPARTYKSVNIGRRTGVNDAYGPHEVAIWNADGEPEITVLVADMITESVALYEQYGIPEDAALSISLREPSNYFVDVGVPSTDTHHRLRVPCGFFDCNDSRTQIGVLGSKDVRSFVTSTMAQCRSSSCTVRSLRHQPYDTVTETLSSWFSD